MRKKEFISLVVITIIGIFCLKNADKIVLPFVNHIFKILGA